MLEELVSIFREANVEGIAEYRERMARIASVMGRRFGPTPLAVSPSSRPLPQPDFLFQLQVPYYHEAASLLVEQKQALESKFGLTPIQAYTLLLRTAQERGISPNRLARSMLQGLEHEPS